MVVKQVLQGNGKGNGVLQYPPGGVRVYKAQGSLSLEL